MSLKPKSYGLYCLISLFASIALQAVARSIPSIGILLVFVYATLDILAVYFFIKWIIDLVRRLKRGMEVKRIVEQRVRESGIDPNRDFQKYYEIREQVEKENSDK